MLCAVAAGCSHTVLLNFVSTHTTHTHNAQVQGPEEQQAAEMMLRAAYSGSVPPDASPEQLLACMVLADR